MHYVAATRLADWIIAGMRKGTGVSNKAAKRIYLHRQRLRTLTPVDSLLCPSL